ncbi:MAG: NACHT domain-containing protein, partial [Anaerolineae bacterium]
TGAYVANLAANLTAQLITATSRGLRSRLQIPETEQALNSAVQAGVIAMLANASAQTGDEQTLVSDIFERFFADRDVATELSLLLKGHPPDQDELAFLFAEAGYDAQTLPGFDFKRGIKIFETAFLTAAAEEAALQATIQTGNLMAQTHIQRELLAEVRRLAEFVRAAKPASIGIEAGTITAENVVSGNQIIYRVSPAAGPLISATWEEHYLRTLIGYCDPLDVTPLDDAYLHSGYPGRDGRLSISDVFTALYLERPRRRADETVAGAMARLTQPRRKEGAEAPFEGSRLGAMGGEAGEPVQAVEGVAAVMRLVILGEPGGGKSTLVNHLAAALARKRLGLAAADALPGWPDEEAPLPVRIILRQFAAWLPGDKTHGEAGDVWDYLAYRLERMGCKESFAALKTTLLGQGGVIFFDGLDEVSETDAEAKRSLIVEATRKFAARLEKCRVVVTCRVYAYQEGDAWRLPEADFPVATLAPFNLEQAAFFTRTWYRLIGPLKGWTADKSDREAQNLYQAIEQYQHLRELSRSPLLLTLMAQVHGRDGTLPRDRADLYERAVNLLLTHWENRIVRDVEGARKVEPGLVTRLGVRTDTLRGALEAVAFTAHERQEQEANRDQESANIPREELRRELYKSLDSYDKAEEVIAYIQDRAGLLQARERHTFSFPHRTFQEFLAATYMLGQAEPVAMLCERARRDLSWWREVFHLAAGISRARNPRLIVDLAMELLPFAPADVPLNDDRAALSILVGNVLVETGFEDRVRQEQAKEPGLFTATFERVRAWLEASLIAKES